MLQKYEIIYILDPSVTPDEAAAVGTKIEQISVDAKGAVIKKDEWGRRRMAYTVKKQREGIYHYIHLSLDAAAVAEVGRQLRLFEKVIKFMITKDEFSGRKKKPVRIKTSLHQHRTPAPGSAPSAPGSASAASAAPVTAPAAPVAAPAAPVVVSAPAPAPTQA